MSTFFDSYRVLVYGAGNSTSTVAFKVHAACSSSTENLLAAPPTVGGQNVDIRRGTAESRPWRVEVLDKSNFMSAKIADASGHLVLLGRICRAQRKTGGSWTTLGTGRITNLSLTPDTTSYALTVQDERWIERNTMVWPDARRDDDWPSTGAKQKAGTFLLPGGVDGEYGSITMYYHHAPMLGSILLKKGDLALVSLDVLGGRGIGGVNYSNIITTRTTDTIVSDIKPDANWGTDSTGNFTTLRIRVNGVERNLHSVLRYLWLGAIPETREQFESELDAWLGTDIGELMLAWVAWSTASAGDAVTQAAIIMPDAKPTDYMPLHIGGQAGINPWKLERKLCNDSKVRISTAAFDALEDDPAFMRMRFRIKGEETKADWSDKNIYQPLGVIPYVDVLGRLAPQKIHLPQNISSTSLFEFTSTNASDPHPDWSNVGRDQITRINFTYPYEKLGIPFAPAFPWGTPKQPEGSFGADFVREEERSFSTDYGRGGSTGPMGVKALDIQLNGYHRAGWTTRIPFSTIEVGVPGTEDVGSYLAKELFDRLGDGPVRGSISGLNPASTVNPSDFVRITLPTFPSPDTQSRGATRIVQILSRMDTSAGPDFEWLDAGPNSAALNTPTLSLAKSTADPYNTVVATIGSLSTTSTDEGWQVQTAVGSTLPSSTSDKWRVSKSGSSTGAFNVVGFPSGNKVWGQVRQRAPGRIRSAWSTADSSTLTALTAPSAIDVSTLSSGGVAPVTFTPGSTKHTLELLHSESTSSTSTKATVATLPPNTTSYTLQGITEGSSNYVGVRHMDDYGGRSALTSTMFTASTSSPTAPGIVLIKILRGSTG